LRKLKIIFVFSLSPRIGGHFKSGLAMVKNLEAMGHHVIVLAPTGVKEMMQSFKDTGAEYLVIDELIKYKRFPNTSGFRQVLRVAKERSVDIIHAQEFQSVGRCFPAAALSGKGFVATEAGGAHRGDLPARRTDTVLFSQEQMAMFSKFHCVRRDDLHLIPARIDTSIYKPEQVRADFKKKYDLPDSEGKKVLLATRLDKAKQRWLDNIFEFARQNSRIHKSVSVFIAGEGEMLAEMSKKAANINAANSSGPIVYLVGPIFSMDEMNQFYNYADVVVGSGRGIMEAMACRKPVIVLGENGEREAVTPENIEDIAYFNFSGRHFRHSSKSGNSLPVQLENLLSDANTRKRLGDFSYEYIRTQLNAQIGAKQLVGIYKRALNKRPSLVDYTMWDIQAIFNIIVLALKRRIPFQVA